MQLELTVGIADFVPETDKSGFDLISRASLSLQNAVGSDSSVN